MGASRSAGLESSWWSTLKRFKSWATSPRHGTARNLYNSINGRRITGIKVEKEAGLKRSFRGINVSLSRVSAEQGKVLTTWSCYRCKGWHIGELPLNRAVRLAGYWENSSDFLWDRTLLGVHQGASNPCWTTFSAIMFSFKKMPNRTPGSYTVTHTDAAQEMSVSASHTREKVPGPGPLSNFLTGQALSAQAQGDFSLSRAHHGYKLTIWVVKFHVFPKPN